MQKRNRKKGVIILVIIMFLLIFTVVAYYQNITTTWRVVIPNTPPLINLLLPVDSTTIYNTTVEFNWTSSDVDNDTLNHMWFLDSLPTMNTPLKTTQDTGEGLNHTPALVMDGVWYWKVEVTDGEDVDTSETRQVTFRNNATNTFPDIINHSISAEIGDLDTIFYYLLTYTDADNNSASAVKVYIDSIVYDMTETDVDDINCTDGKDYYYYTSLDLGIHNYSFYVSDGISFNTTSIMEGPIVVIEYYQVPQITLMNPLPGEVFLVNNITFIWNITDPDNDLLYTELWLWQGANEQKQIYDVSSGVEFDLSPATYYWQILAVDEHGENISEKRMFGVVASGKQCSVTIQADDTTEPTGGTFTGDLVITNEGPMESYEVYWYVELWDEDKDKRISGDAGSLAVTTTVTVSFEVEIPEDIAGGDYYLLAFAYDSAQDNASLIGTDELAVEVEARIILHTDMTVIWHSLIYDTPRYGVDLEEFPHATQVRIPLTYNYSWLLFSGNRALKGVEIYLFTDNVFIKATPVFVSMGVYSFGEVESKDTILIVVPNPSATDSTVIFNWLHPGDIVI